MTFFSYPLHPRVLLYFSACVYALASPQLWSQTPSSQPWNLEQLNQPPQYRWLDEQSPVRSLIYTGETYSGNATEVFAYYASPNTLASATSLDVLKQPEVFEQPDVLEQPDTVTKPAIAEPIVHGKFPGVVLIHGGGGTAFSEWTELWAKRGYAAIAMDLAGARPIEGKNPHQAENRTRLEHGGPDQGDAEKFGSIDKPANQQWPYHAVANVVLAHSLLRSFPEVDAELTAVTGISWGGYLTCIVAGVDQRFDAAVPVYGCGFLHENSAWLPQFAGMTDAQRTQWIELWDPSQYLPRATMPLLFVNGTNDFAYPLDSYMKSFDCVPERPGAPKQLCVTVNMPHGHPPGWAPQEIGLFIDQCLHDGRSLPVVGQPQLNKDQVSAPLLGDTPVESAELHFTTDTTPINQRQWTTLPAVVAAGQVLAAAPPTTTTAWFFTVKDDRGAVISTRVVLP